MYKNKTKFYKYIFFNYIAIMHAISFFYMLALNCKGGEAQLFFESQYDPLVHDEQKTPASKLEALESLSGFFNNHDHHVPSSIETFGDISLLSINFYKQILVSDEIESNMNEFIKLLDTTHPTLIAIQGITEEEIKYLTQYIESDEHYGIKNTNKGTRDYLSGTIYYLPIIYDIRLVSIEKEDYFLTSEAKPQPFGSYVVVKDKRLPNKKVAFTLVNMDLYSSFGDVVSAEFFNIIDDVANAKDVQDSPVLLAGNLGVVPANVREAMEVSYSDLIQVDRNNKKLSKTTEHSKNNDDDIQRSYILLKDVNEEFKVNYARILSEYKAGDHYPLYAILTLVNSIAEIKQAQKVIGDESKKEDAKKQEKGGSAKPQPNQPGQGSQAIPSDGALKPVASTPNSAKPNTPTPNPAQKN